MDEKQPEPQDGLGSVMHLAATAEVIPGPKPDEDQEAEEA